MISLAKIYSLEFAQSLRDRLIRHGPIVDRDHSLVVCYGMIDLFAAVRRSCRFRTDDEDEILRGFDIGEYFLLPFCCQWNVFPINPSLAFLRGKGIAKLAHEFLVLAGIRR